MGIWTSENIFGLVLKAGIIMTLCSYNRKLNISEEACWSID